MRTILIADEDAGVRELISLAFSDSSRYMAVAVSNGIDAILKAKDIKPDIVLVDISLRYKNGYEVSREIREDPRLKNTTVVLLSASLGLFNETSAAEAGADDFIIKPFGSEELINRLESLIDKKEPSETDGKIGGALIKSLIDQFGKLKYTGMVVAPLVLFMIMLPILYLNQSRAKSKLIRSSNPLSSKADVTRHGVESKPIPIVSREEKITVTMNDKPIVKGEEKIAVPMNDKRVTLIENSKYAVSELKAETPTLLNARGKELEDEYGSLRACTEVPYGTVMEAMDEKKKTFVTNVELVTEPVLVFESGQPGSGEFHGEEVKTFRPEKRVDAEELKKVEPRKREGLGVKEQKAKERDEKLVKAKSEGATKKGKTIMPTTSPGGKYVVQVGAFQKEEDANGIVERLKSKGYPAFVEKSEGSVQGAWYRIRIGLFKTRGEAKLYGNTLKIREPWVGKVVVVLEEAPKEKDVSVSEASSLGRGIQENGSYLTGIRITDWSIYVAWCVPNVHHVTIENTNEMAYKDIKVKVRYYSGSYSSAGTTEIGESMGILHLTLPPHSKRTYLEKGVALQQGSVCGLYVGPADMKILGAIPVSSSYNSAN